MSNLNISNIGNGALIEKANADIEKILQNILDLNTSPIQKRKLTLTITFVPYEDRSGANIVYETKNTLAPFKPGTTRIAVGQTSEGIVLVQEINKDAMIGQSTIDTETGEVNEPVVPNKLIKIK